MFPLPYLYNMSFIDEFYWIVDLESGSVNWEAGSRKLSAGSKWLDNTGPDVAWG